MAKKKKYDPKEPGQQYEEIENAQKKLGHHQIAKVDKSKKRDREELKQLAEEAIKKRQSASSDHEEEHEQENEP